jgi:hypothetical protein
MKIVFFLEWLEAWAPVSDEAFERLDPLGSVYVGIEGDRVTYFAPSRRSAAGLLRLFPSIPRSKVWSLPTLREVNRILGVEDDTFLRTILAWDQDLGMDDDATIRDVALSVIPPSLVQA